ncbi:MAG: anaerobic ribonucleoside-triphosphate reductase activating protein [Bacilli bacterium]|nr:anaerobic ribonucleoside-triphosphate reductase activating protein [Bacilli bacterium]
MTINLARDIQKDSIVDGAGIRAVIWTQGCSHNCFGCHNPDTHDFSKGIKVDIENIKKELDNLEMHDGITFSGGDPMFQASSCAEIAKYAKKLKLNVWCYTGFTFEELLSMCDTNPNIKEFLDYIDVLIDGKFILEQKSLALKYRGSKNQRILNVKNSLKNKKASLIRKYN